MLNTSYADLAIFAGMLAGFFAISKVMLNQIAKREVQVSIEREADRQERIKLAEAIGRLAASGDAQAKATVDGFNKQKFVMDIWVTRISN
jgi:hypothetical protein